MSVDDVVDDDDDDEQPLSEKNIVCSNTFYVNLSKIFFVYSLLLDSLIGLLFGIFFVLIFIVNWCSCINNNKYVSQLPLLSFGSISCSG